MTFQNCTSKHGGKNKTTLSLLIWCSGVPITAAHSNPDKRLSQCCSVPNSWKPTQMRFQENGNTSHSSVHWSGQAVKMEENRFISLKATLSSILRIKSIWQQMSFISCSFWWRAFAAGNEVIMKGNPSPLQRTPDFRSSSNE